MQYRLDSSAALSSHLPLVIGCESPAIICIYDVTYSSLYTVHSRRRSPIVVLARPRSYRTRTKKGRCLISKQNARLNRECAVCTPGEHLSEDKVDLLDALFAASTRSHSGYPATTVARS